MRLNRIEDINKLIKELKALNFTAFISPSIIQTKFQTIAKFPGAEHKVLEAFDAAINAAAKEFEDKIDDAILGLSEQIQSARNTEIIEAHFGPPTTIEFRDLTWKITDVIRVLDQTILDNGYLIRAYANGVSYEIAYGGITEILALAIQIKTAADFAKYATGMDLPEFQPDPRFAGLIGEWPTINNDACLVTGMDAYLKLHPTNQLELYVARNGIRVSIVTGAPEHIAPIAANIVKINKINGI